MNTDKPISPCACNDNPALWTIDPVASIAPQPQQTTMPVNSDDDKKRALLSDISLFGGVMSALLFFFG